MDGGVKYVSFPPRPKPELGSTLSPSIWTWVATLAQLVSNSVRQRAVCAIIMTDTTEWNKLKLLYLEFELLIQSKMWRDEAGRSRCSDCDYSSQFPTNVKNHIEAHHVQGIIQEYKCEYCLKFFKSKNSFQTHKSRYKNGKCQKFC